jgi:hypothetical protein
MSTENLSPIAYLLAENIILKARLNALQAITFAHINIVTESWDKDLPTDNKRMFYEFYISNMRDGLTELQPPYADAASHWIESEIAGIGLEIDKLDFYSSQKNTGV